MLPKAVAPGCCGVWCPSPSRPTVNIASHCLWVVPAATASPPLVPVPRAALHPTSPRRVEVIASAELLQNYKGTRAALTCGGSHIPLPTRKTVPSVGFTHTSHRSPVSRAGVPEQTPTLEPQPLPSQRPCAV